MFDPISTTLLAGTAVDLLDQIGPDEGPLNDLINTADSALSLVPGSTQVDLVGKLFGNG